MTALSERQPYPGLRPFDLGDEDFFFGREAQTRSLYAKLKVNRLIAVVGRSGCGKSSLVRAGLVPLLKAETAARQTANWRIAMFRPQGRPLRELSDALLRLKTEGRDEAQEGPAAETQALRQSRMDAMLRRNSLGLVEAARELMQSSTDELLIVVDQFEEIFRFEGTSSGDAEEATTFVRLLVEAINVDTPRIHVLLTMRLDFLGDCARFPRLPEAISDGQFLVPNLSRAERRAAIEEPAKKFNKQIKPEVTQRLLNEIGEDPDQLPVLQHVLMRMWQQAGNNTEIALADYDKTGGVRSAITQHADHIYKDLPTDIHRLAARRLFKAISERDYRGRIIRRATRLGEIIDIVTQDNKQTASAESSRILVEVIEAFREPQCCFLMPPAEQPLVDASPIDISHESLLRGWTQLTGKPGQEGWIAEEDRDGRTYRGLLEAAENDFKLSMRNAYQRRQWWDAVRPNRAWAERYGNKFDIVEKLVTTSAFRALVLRYSLIALCVTALLSFAAAVVINSFWIGERSQRQALDAKYEALDAKLTEITLQGRQVRSELTAVQEQKNRLEETIRQAQRVVPKADQQVQQDLDTLLKQTSSSSDNLAQRAVVDVKAGAPATLATDTGYMWIGSMQTGNLNSPSGATVLPDAVKIDGQYLTALDIYLRQGLPDPATYSQKATAGIMPEGTRVRIMSAPVPFTRPSGDQYWARVQIVKLALSTVYFQFAGGSREQAQQLSRALQEIGYKIPGEERTGAAAGKREVRYFYNGQKNIADRLAADTTQALQRLGYSSLTVTPVLASAPTKSNPDGKLELWLEIPPR
ncbi:MAG: ATP-binding protein [Bradyrhizobium sp.]